MNPRGMFTEELAKRHDLRSRDELRILPYLQYLLINRLPIDPAKITPTEHECLIRWRNEGRITFSMTRFPTCTEDFWLWMNRVLWESYAAHPEEKDTPAQNPEETPDKQKEEPT